MYMQSPNLACNVSIKLDTKPLKIPGLRRFSLIFTGDDHCEMEIKGFLLPADNREISSPSVLLGGKKYSICTLSPSMQERLLRCFEFEDLFPVREEPVESAPVREYLR
jgi:hypothetical protein